MKLMKSILLWVLAFVLMASAAIYQKGTGPTYPIIGDATIAGNTIEYRLTRSHGGTGDHPVAIPMPDPDVQGEVYWKRYKLDEPLRVLPMERVFVKELERAHDGSHILHEGNPATDEGFWMLAAYLPHQPPAGKLEYEVVLHKGAERLVLPETGEMCVIRFKGRVPPAVLFPHIVSMFLAMLFSMRAALAVFAKEKLKTLAWMTIIALTIGGLILGPIVQKYAFGAYWTGWPFGEDLTDNKTLAAFIAWFIALWMLSGKKDGEKRGRWWTLGAAAVLLAVYLIPHSMRGSELDYSQVNADSLRILEVPSEMRDSLLLESTGAEGAPEGTMIE